MRLIFYAFFIAGINFKGLSNDINVHNAYSVGKDEVNDVQTVRFDVSWSNSWRVTDSVSNYDAAWVFIKYRVGDGNWHHASLIDASVADPSESTFTLAPDGVGAMLYRSQPGVGDVTHEGITLTWDYGADGVADAAETTMEIFAVEMVYVPQGSYYLGSGGEGTREFYEVGVLSAQNYQVNSEASIVMGVLPGSLNYSVPLLEGKVLNNIPAEYPKGYVAFYCMKYEVSQQQYASFYNSATPAQRAALVLEGMGSRQPETAFTRNGLAILADGTATTMAPNVPVNWISPAQILAFLDWAGLRPMTELEFEKSCRGTADPLADGYAWGTSTVCTAAYFVVDSYLKTETLAGLSITDASDGSGVYSWNCPEDGPLRSGIFASSFPTREGSGGSFYGIMELSGNLSEYTVAATNATGRLYTGRHGDGTLTVTGTANVNNWPTATAGFGTRGGAFSLGPSAMRVSDRTYALSTFSPSRAIGFRGVRTAHPE